MPRRAPTRATRGEPGRPRVGRAADGPPPPPPPPTPPPPPGPPPPAPGGGGGGGGWGGGGGGGGHPGGGGRASARAHAHPLPPLLLSQAAYDAVSKRLRDAEAHLEAAFDAAAVKAPKEGWRAAAQA